MTDKHGEADFPGLQEMVRCVGDGVLMACEATPSRRIHYVAGNCVGLFALTADEILGEPLATRVLADDAKVLAAVIAAAMETGGHYQTSYRLRGADGRVRWVSERGVLVMPTEAAEPALWWLLQDEVTAQVHLRETLAESTVRFHSLFNNAVVGIFQSTPEGRYLRVNQALAMLYRDPSPAALIARMHDISSTLYRQAGRRQEFQRLIEAQGRVNDFESEVVCADGRVIWISENAWPVRAPSGELLYYEGMVTNVSERHSHQAALEFQATHDPLTGLPNRNQLLRRLDLAAQVAVASQGAVAFAFVDLDNFKIINDSLGHIVGDEVLLQVGKRLCDALRSSDSVVRYGGDEFILLCNFSGQRSEIEHALERVLQTIQAPMTVLDHVLHLSCSIGVAISPDDGNDLATLLRLADVAMYQAKKRGKAAYHFYVRAMNLAAQERFSLEGALRHALSVDDQIEVVFQPKVNRVGEIVSAEALVRWRHPEHGLIMPDRFIPLAEETGLILRLGRRVLELACWQAARWPAPMRTLAAIAGGAGEGGRMSVAVNLSARQLADPALVDDVQSALRRSGLPPNQLELEITESMLMGSIEKTIGVLQGLRQLGLKIAIDDFGTGYSSLSYLRHLPIDVLKIDRSFVNGCEREGEWMIIPHAIVFLGKSLSLKIVAEGIERHEQFEILRNCGCDEFQGYFFARPLDGEAIVTFIATYLPDEV